MRSSTMGSETGSANPLTASIHGITHAAYRIVPGMGRRQKKIHRSLSDSKYGTTDSSTVVLLPHLGKMRSGSSNFVVAGNDVYRINRGSSWGTGTSRMSLVSMIVLKSVGGELKKLFYDLTKFEF